MTSPGPYAPDDAGVVKSFTIPLTSLPGPTPTSMAEVLTPETLTVAGDAGFGFLASSLAYKPRGIQPRKSPRTLVRGAGMGMEERKRTGKEKRVGKGKVDEEGKGKGEGAVEAALEGLGVVWDTNGRVTETEAQSPVMEGSFDQGA
ncbi:hypothetical protein MMC30_008902 [Trapelia coarctata]|nr:hypothetical protein [Trapelia coarctata]